VFRREGKLLRKMVSVRERDPRLRKAAILKYGRLCMVCGLDFANVYGEETRDCIHIHHLHLIGDVPKQGRRVSVTDVIIVCPNCHSALHCQKDPSAWRVLKRMILAMNAR
jgi:5-methylcytosine-specific restriction enzyme A